MPAKPKYKQKQIETIPSFMNGKTYEAVITENRDKINEIVGEINEINKSIGAILHVLNNMLHREIEINTIVRGS